MSASGTVYLIGAGPGAPDLLTVRAARLLARADIVFHDALVHPETIALAAHAEKVAVGKRCGRHSAAQHFINKRLIDAARKHGIVVRLKGGDPMVFGRSQEEIDALTAAGVPVEVVPGITAALAAAAQLRVSLTRRGLSRSLTLVTPRTGSGVPGSDWSDALPQADTLAIYMGAAEAASVRQSLLGRGYSPQTPIALCESVSLPGSQALRGSLADLPALAAQLGDGPALILIGKVFAQAKHEAIDAGGDVRASRARGGDMSFPGEGPHAVGIDRKANGAGHRRLGGLVASTGSEVPACGDRPQSESTPAADNLAVDQRYRFGGGGTGDEAAAVAVARAIARSAR